MAARISMKGGRRNILKSDLRNSRVQMESTRKAKKNLNQTTVTGGSSLVIIFRIMAMNPQRDAVKNAYNTPFLLSVPIIAKIAKMRNILTGWYRRRIRYQ